MIEVKVDVPELSVIEKKMGNFSKRAPEALRDGINTSMQPINRFISKIAQQEYTYKAKISDIGRTRATVKKLYGSMTYGGKPIPLDHFQYRRGTHGERSFRFGYMSETPGEKLSVRVKKSDPMKPVAHAMVIRAGGAKIFQRKAEEGENPDIASRLRSMGILPTHYNDVHIKRLHSMDAGHMVENKVVAEDVQKFAQQTVNERTETAIQNVMYKIWIGR